MTLLVPTTRATTRLVLIYVVRYCSVAGAAPFKLNPRSLRFEELHGWWAHARLGATVLGINASVLYSAVTQMLIFRGTIHSGSIANSGVHLQFTICQLLAGGLHLYVVANAQPFVKTLNQALRFWAHFEERHGLKEPVSAKERLLQLTLCSMLIATPVVCVSVLLSDPFATRYPTWLIRQMDLATDSPILHAILSTLAATLHLSLMPTFIGILLLLPTFFLLYLHRMALWLVQLRDNPLASRTADEALRSFRELQVLHCLARKLICPFLLPFGLLGIYLLGILLNFLLIVHHPSLPAPFVPPYAISSFICAGILVHGGQFAARVHIVSGQLVRRWGRYARETRDQRLGACVPLCIHVGPFFPFKRSTAYKLVLFLVLNTFKVVLTFGKQK